MKPKIRRATELSRILFADSDDALAPVHRLLEKAIEARATDIHLDPVSSGYTARFRIDGAIRDFGELSHDEGEHLLNQFKVMTGIDPGAQFLPRASRQTVELKNREVDLRFTLVPCISGPKLAVRLLDPSLVHRSLESLGMSGEQLAQVKEWLLGMGGLFIVGGPTGSGKTTTLYALLHELVGSGRHVVTIEDPVEYEIDGINQIQVDPVHELDFPRAVRSMLRLDPDDLMVGEIRDEETSVAAIRAAGSGHTVFTTIHARDAVSTVTTLRNFGGSNHDIATSAAVIVNQRLLRKLCPDCRDRGAPTAKEITWFKRSGLDVPDEVYHPGGCHECGFTGYRGRTGVFEIWRPGATAYERLLDGSDERSLRRHLAEDGHRGLLESALDLMGRGETSAAELISIGAGTRADDWTGDPSD